MRSPSSCPSTWATGYALRVGYAAVPRAGAEYVVTLDADGQNDPGEIQAMLRPAGRRRGRLRGGVAAPGPDATADRFRKAGVRRVRHDDERAGRGRT